MEWTPNAVTWAVLGLEASKPRSGYDIKNAVDGTIRHFWAASYGQIYPELKRLEQAGWIEGDDASNGGRARRVFRITAAGRDALRGWFFGAETRIELRDESLLRLFFADQLPPGEAIELLEGRREGYRQMLAYLRSLDDGSGVPDPPYIDLVYRWGLEYCEWGIEWCDRHLRRQQSRAAA